MEDRRQDVLLSPEIVPVPEGGMLKEQVVEEVLARVRAGEAVVALARAYGVDPKTVRAWRDRGAYRERSPRAYPSVLAAIAEWLRLRAPEVEYNAAVLHRELSRRASPALR